MNAGQFLRAVPQLWQNLGDRFPAVFVLDAVLRSYGQVIFSDNPLSGLFMVAGLSLFSGKLVLYSFLGALAALFSSRLAHEDKYFLRHGISGYNGVIFGIFWSWYFQISLPALVMFTIMAFLLTPTRHAMLRSMFYSRFRLPIMNLPSVAVIYLALLVIYWLVYSAGLILPLNIYTPYDAVSSPLFTLPSLNGNSHLAFIQKHYIHAWVIILCGIFIHSRISAVIAVFGFLVGYALCGIIPDSVKVGEEVFLGFNAFPVATILFGIFFLPTFRTLVFTLAAVVFCALLWILLVYVLKFINLPFLTLPFNITVLLSLILSRRMFLQRIGIFTVPLHMISRPEAIRNLCGEGSVFETWAAQIKYAAGLFSNIGRMKLTTLTRLRKKKEEAGRFLDIIADAERVSIVSGAGTSTESGIPDFRGDSSYWKIYGADDFTLPNFLAKAEVRQKYWLMQLDFSALVKRVKPNPVHRAAKYLEDLKKLECILTQNVDGLFQKAGVSPEKVIELHGNIESAICVKCKTRYPIKDADEAARRGNYSTLCRSCGGLIKPATVLMGEELNGECFSRAGFRLLSSDLIVIIGTSLRVEPIASLVDMVIGRGIKTVIINTCPTEKDNLATLVIHERAGAFFKRILSRMRVGQGLPAS